MNEVLSLLNIGVAMSTPLIICVLGGVFPHKAGVLNIAMDGMMNMGAFASILFTVLTGNVVFGILMGVVCSVILGLIFSAFSISLEGNKIITGLAINLLSTSLVPFFLQTAYGNRTSLMATDIIDLASFRVDVPILRDIPILGPIFNNQTILTYVSFLLILVMWFVMYKTKFGIYVRVVGGERRRRQSGGHQGQRHPVRGHHHLRRPGGAGRREPVRGEPGHVYPGHGGRPWLYRPVGGQMRQGLPGESGAVHLYLWRRPGPAD